jgi:hypothetical protein
MAHDTESLPRLPAVAGKTVEVAFDGGHMTSDAGVVLLAAVERRLGIAERLAACIADPRAPARVRHSLADMIRYRMLLIAAGYPDGNDCDALKADPAFKIALGCPPVTGANLCSQPTISRLENLPGATALKRMMAAPSTSSGDRCVLRQLRGGAAAPPARHRRYRGHGAWRPGARRVQRSLR